MTTIDISRIGGEEQRIEIVLRFGVGKTITAIMSPEDFALALTGRSEIPVDIKLRRTFINHDCASRKLAGGDNG
ncbi:hypothetical protein ACIJH7_000204 [Yersinia enterocolitica]|uniref:hypothetical protein n=1 Tax=Yersinia enterocolitica TaxID=630 RepID=UPI0021E79014|nr:hypothetical protein [Yersinia enterocolitica]UYK09419.1 hypothetical protein N4226_15295 [Yersinia enterocolitica]HDL7969693.1 hypothetical protein [Yersinia enterocolitica]